MSAGNTVEIIFHTDHTVTGGGWEMVWTSDQVVTCDQDHGHDTGSVQLHHMETGYHLPYNCTQTISVPGGKVYSCPVGQSVSSSLFLVNYKVILNFTFFNFGQDQGSGCGSDHVNLDLGYDNVNLCGNLTSTQFISTSNSVSLKTVSETGWSSGHGFKVSYSKGKIRNYFILLIVSH